jgi:hypothetical protein
MLNTNVASATTTEYGLYSAAALSSEVMAVMYKQELERTRFAANVAEMQLQMMMFTRKF